MNRNVLFRQSLLSAAVVAVLNSYSVGAVANSNAESCSIVPNSDPAIVVASDSSCDGITIDGATTANIVVNGQVNSPDVGTNSNPNDDTAIKISSALTGDGDIINNGNITGEHGIEILSSGSVRNINNTKGGRIAVHANAINLDAATANSIINSGIIDGYEGNGIALSNGSSVDAGISNSGDLYGGANGIYIDSNSDVDPGSFTNADNGTDNAAIFNAGHILGFEAGIRLVNSTAETIVNDKNSSIDGYFGIRIDSVHTSSSGVTILNRNVIHGSNPYGGLAGIEIPAFDDIPIVDLGDDHDHLGFPEGGDDFSDLLPGGGEGFPDAEGVPEDHDHGLDVSLGIDTSIPSHAIYSAEAVNKPITVTNESSGLIYGRVSGSTLTLNNSGKFKTQSGSKISAYSGTGTDTLVAVLNDKLLAVGASAPVGEDPNDYSSSVLEAVSISFSDGSQILVDSNYSYQAPPEGANYVIADATNNDIAGDQFITGETVGSASALLDVELINADDSGQLIVKVTPKEAGSVIAKFGVPVGLQQLMNDFIEIIVPQLKEFAPDSRLAELFEEAARSEETLLALSEALEPETSGSSTAGATITQSASFASVSTRTSSSRTGTNTGDLFQDGGVWAQYLHSQGEQDDRNGSGGFDSHLNGITFGVDGDLNDQWTLGIALTAADVTTSSTGSSSITGTTSYIGTLYGSWQHNDRFVDIMVSGGVGKNENEQVEITGRTTAEFDVKQLGLRLVTGQDFWLDNQAMLLQPNLSFNYGRVDVDSYEEIIDSEPTSAIDEQRYEVMELGAGMTAMKSFELDRGVLDASLSLNVYHDFAADQVQVTSSFIGSDTRTTHIGEEPEKTTWQAGVGLNYQISNTLSASINYDHTRKSTFAADSASIKLRYDF